jgi:uncharacterized protein (TIGR02265 family)
MLRIFSVDLDTPLTLNLDPEERCALVPRDHVVKGIFFAPKAELLGEDFATVERRLLAPPRLGRYLPHGDYPAVDCARICFAAATKAFPDLPIAEACRRLGRSDALAFYASPRGLEMLGFPDSVESALLRLPSVYMALHRGVACSARKRSNGALRLEFSGLWATLDNLHIGMIEAAVMHFGARPTIEFTMLALEHATFDVRWE